MYRALVKDKSVQVFPTVYIAIGQKFTLSQETVQGHSQKFFLRGDVGVG